MTIRARGPAHGCARCGYARRVPSPRARVVLVSPRGRVALIRRRRSGQEYWSFPGGGLHRGETPDRAARREVSEELGLDVRLQRLLGVVRGHVLFLARLDREPPLTMQGPEVADPRRRAEYDPTWVPLADLDRLDIRPRTVRPVLAALLAEEPAGSAPAGEAAEVRAASQWGSAHRWLRGLLGRVGHGAGTRG
jgi:8-oxo-dGTP diphosphatase